MAFGILGNIFFALLLSFLKSIPLILSFYNWILLSFIGYPLSDVEIEKQSLIRGQTVQADYFIKLNNETFNLDGLYFSSNFSRTPQGKFHSYSHSVEIFSPNGERIFFSNSPRFDLVYFDKSSEMFIFLEGLDHEDGEFWIVDSLGSLKYRNKYSQSFVSTTSEQSRFESIFRYSDSNTLSGFELEDEESDAKIIISCGARQRWTDSIVNIDKDSLGRFKGFAFIQNGKYRYFSKQAFESQQQSILNILQETQSGFYCEHEYDVLSSAFGDDFTLWCESKKGERHGQLESWRFTSEVISWSNESIENFSQDFQITEKGTLYKSLVGEYQLGLKVGSWRKNLYFDDFTYRSSDVCQFELGKLNGLCESREDGSVYLHPFKNGLIDGTKLVYFDGELEEKCEYSQGFKNGECIIYDNGSVYEKCLYQGESLYGTCTDYYSDTNEIEQRCEVRGNERHGLCTEYARGGAIQSLSYYEEDTEVWTDQE